MENEKEKKVLGCAFIVRHSLCLYVLIMKLSLYKKKIVMPWVAGVFFYSFKVQVLSLETDKIYPFTRLLLTFLLQNNEM